MKGRRRPSGDDNDGGDSTNPFADDDSASSNNPFASNPFAAPTSSASSSTSTSTSSTASAPPPSSSSSASSAMASYYAQLAAPAPAAAPATPPAVARKSSTAGLPTPTGASTSLSSPSTSSASSPSPTFKIERLDDWKPNKEQGSILALSAGSDVLCIGTSNNFLIRWNVESSEIDAVQLSKRVDDRIHRVFIDPFGHHCLISMANGVTYYLHCHWNKAHTLSKLKGLVIESVAWNHLEGSSIPTSHRILLGTSKGLIFEAQLDEKEKDKHVKKLYDLNEGDGGGAGGGGGGPISGLSMEAFPDVPAGEPDRFLIIAATPTRQYQFIGGPTFEKVFERYASMPAFLELPGDLGYSELRSYAKYATTAEPLSQPASTVAWLTGAGIYYGELRFAQQAEVGEHVLEDGKLLAYPQDPVTRAIIPPLSLVVTEFHFLLLTPSRLIAINQLSEEIVYEENFNTKTTGEMVGLAYDPVNSVKWLYSNRAVFEVVIEGEDREMWRLFLQQGKYEEALEYAESEEDKQEVMTAHADYYFTNRQYQLAAKLYAKTNRPFEEVALKFVQLSTEKQSIAHIATQSAQPSHSTAGQAGAHADGGVNGTQGGAPAAGGHSDSGVGGVGSSSTSSLDARSALKIYLLEKLEQLPSTAIIQQMMICTWLTEIFLDNINRLQDPPPTPALTDAAEQRKAAATTANGGAGAGEAAAEDDGAPGPDTSFSPFRLEAADGKAISGSMISLNSPTSSPLSSASAPPALFDDDPFASLSSDERGDLLAAELDEFHTFLRDRSDCLNKQTTIELLSSHGRMEEWLLYAKDDLEWVLQQHMQEEHHDAALNLLRRHAQPAKITELYYKFVPALIVHRPKETLDLLLDVRPLDPAKLIPALMRYEEHFDAAQQSGHALPSDAPPPSNLALRYLEYCVYRLRNRDPVVHNYLISLYASEADSSPFLRYLDSQKQSPVFDTQYALRVCYDHGQQQACVAIYTMMRLYEEAVTLALTFDIPLAKRVIHQAEQTLDSSAAAAAGAAAPPANGLLTPTIDASTAKRLWLLIAKQIISTHSNSISTAMSLLQDCGRLSLEDLLPFFPDFVRIGELKGEIARSLDAYNRSIEALHGEMAASTSAAAKIRADLQSLKGRSGAVSVGRKCDICGLPVLSQPFLLFPCTHCVHTECAKQEMQSYWDKHPQVRKRAIADRVQREKRATRDRQQRGAAAATGGAGTAAALLANASAAADDWSTLSKQTKEARVLSEAIASECVLCGSLMIDSVQLPFIAEQDPAEIREIETWKI